MAIEPDQGNLHVSVDASFVFNSIPIGPLSQVCSRVRSGLGPSRAEVGLASPCRLCQALLSAPPSSGRCLVRHPSAFSFPLPFQGLPALGYRCVGVGVFSFFPFFFCVLRLASRLSSCHLIFIVILFSFPFHHLPRCCGVCVCVPAVEM